VGIVTIGLAHAANMFIPNWTMTFTLPVWWSMSHAVAIAASVHRIEDKRPYFGMGRILSLVAAWLFWSAVLLGGGAFASAGSAGGFWPQISRGDQLVGSGPIGLVWPVLALAAFLLLVRAKVAGHPGPAGSEKLRRYGAMWQAVYAAAWLMAAGLRAEALGMADADLLDFVLEKINERTLPEALEAELVDVLDEDAHRIVAALYALLPRQYHR
jgi:hypothetical protein